MEQPLKYVVTKEKVNVGQGISTNHIDVNNFKYTGVTLTKISQSMILMVDRNGEDWYIPMSNVVQYKVA